MEKINFTNKKAPAINGYNLNQLQTNIENAINENNYKGDFLNVTLSEDFILSSANYTTIPFKDIYFQNGSSLTLNGSGGIVIGANVQAVRLYGLAYYYSGTVGQKGVQIYKNSDLVSRKTYQNVPSYTGLDISTTISVVEGDVIVLQVMGANGDLIKDYNHATQFVVEVVK